VAAESSARRGVEVPGDDDEPDADHVLGAGAPAARHDRAGLTGRCRGHADLGVTVTRPGPAERTSHTRPVPTTSLVGRGPATMAVSSSTAVTVSAGWSRAT